jgi:hypothetical protein
VTKGLRHTVLWGRDAFHFSDLHMFIQSKSYPRNKPRRPIGL